MIEDAILRSTTIERKKANGDSRADASQDADFEAFQQMLPQLLREHKGEYALIINQQVVCIDADESALLEYAYTEFPDKDGLIQPIQESLPIFDMGGAANLAE